MNTPVLSATACHLTVHVDRYGYARVVRETGRTIWTGVQRFSSGGDYRLDAGNLGNGPCPEDRMHPAMVTALERALDAAHDAKFGRAAA